MMKQAVILFTRVPEPGKTKTRMMPHLTPGQCARLHTCFLMDIAVQCRKSGADIFVSFTPEGGRGKLEGILGPAKGWMAQRGDTLGARMYTAIEEVLGLGYDACLLIGTDVPELKAEHLEKAFRVLEEKDAVFGRTADGGYYLVGMKRPLKEAFALDKYGHGKVLEETLRSMGQAGLSVGCTDTLSDMDTCGDLRGYTVRMCGNRAMRRSFTGRYLAKIRKVSVIVPVYNESATIGRMQEQLAPLLGKCEILFVDGGSTDDTLAKIDPAFTVIRSAKGRARQMNEGARQSTGDILFFLHCDSELPDHALARLKKVMRDHRAGCFGIAFHSKNFFMFTCRVISNHRVKDRKVMFGDQGIFLERDLFFQAGMFPELPVMEDYQFSLTLKEMGVKLGIADRRIYTSDRRFPKGTVPKLKLMWKMNRLRKMYRDGVDIQKIADLYRDVR